MYEVQSTRRGGQARGDKQEPRLDAAGKKSLLLTKD